ncbi:MAG: hypothetical protein J3K34DRAFT_483969 [Monoraphidium minutum]|nr:MAG: hypothetical protein J3K34DRAFT_483969 [Monoraphidium minutum]
MALPYDALFVGSFAYAGYRTLGRWLKFNEDNAKHREDADFFESVNEVLDKQAAEGGRGAARMGAGAAASGQGQLWAEWPRMRPEQRAKMLEEMLKVLRLTGQDQRWRHLRRAKGGSWAKLTPKQRGELVWAADALDWSFVQDLVSAADAPPAGPLIWQITDPMPQLSEEPLRARGPREEAAGLRAAVAAEEAAVSKALRAGQVAAAGGLAPVEGLSVADAARRVNVLRELLQGTLGLSTGGRARRGQELMELLRGISLDPASSAAKQLRDAAVQELTDEIEAAIKPRAEEAAKEKATAEARSRALAAASVLQGRLRAAAGGRLAPPAAAALVALGLDEIEGRLAPGGGAGALPPGAGAEVLSVASLLGSVLAALSNGLAATGGGAEPPAAVAEAIEAAAALQAELEAALSAAAQKAAAGGEGGEGEGDGEGGAGEEDGAPPALAALRGLLAAVAAAGEGGAEGGGEGMEGLLAEMKNDVETRTSESTAALSARHAAALDAARDRERASRVLRRGQLIMAPPAADEPAEVTSERPTSPVKRLAYAELYLRQLGGRSLGGALPDAAAFVAAAGGAAGLAGGLDLEPGAAEAAGKLERLLDEMALIDDVLKLELGPETAPVLGRVSKYLDARDRAGAGGGAAGGADSELEELGGGAAAEAAAAAAAEALTPRREKEREAAGAVREAIGALRDDGLVALGLPAAQYRTLAALREAAGGLRGGAAEPAAYERAVGALRQVAGQLGDVGATIQVKLAGAEDEGTRSLMAGQKERAVDLYTRLQAFLAYEDSTRGPAIAAVRALKAAADAAVVEGSGPAAVAAALAKAEAAEQQAAALSALLDKLPAPPPPPAGAPPAFDAAASQAAAVAEAAAGLGAISEAAGKLRSELAGYLSYAALRERALATLARSSGAAGPGAGTAGAAEEGVDAEGVTMALGDMEADLNAPLRSLASVDEDELAEWEGAGLRSAARGQVAAILIATGIVPGAAGPPAARAAAAAPGLPSGKCALQLYAERLLRLQQLAAAAAHGANAPVTRPVQFVIMTSPDTHAEITRLLEGRRYFGLERSQVTVITCSARTPCLDADLKAVMSGPMSLAMAPPGSGELLPTLKHSGALAHLLRAGVRHIEVNALDDNLLWRPADPVFIGYAASLRASAAAKVAEPSSLARAYGAAAAGFPPGAEPGELLDSIALQAPAVGCYYFSAAALERLCAAYAADPLAGLRLVPARGIPKRGSPPAMPALPPNLPPQARAQALAAAARAAEAAAAPRPAEGYALQRFLADCLRYGDLFEAGSVALLGVERDEEFATLWSRGPHWAVGPPEGGVARLMGLHTAWVEGAGGEVVCEEGVEVSPLLSYAGEGLDKAAAGAAFDDPYDPALQAAGGAGAGGSRPRSNAGPWLAPLALAYAAVAGLAVAKSAAKALGGGGGGSA